MGDPFPQNCPFPFLGPTSAHNTNGISIGFRHFCTDDCRVSLYFTLGRPFPPSKLPFPMGGSGPHLIHGSLGPPISSTQTASRSVQSFLQGSLIIIIIIIIDKFIKRHKCLGYRGAGGDVNQADCRNRKVFNWRLKPCSESHSVMFAGRLFQVTGAA